MRPILHPLPPLARKREKKIEGGQRTDAAKLLRDRKNGTYYATGKVNGKQK